MEDGRALFRVWSVSAPGFYAWFEESISGFCRNLRVDVGRGELGFYVVFFHGL